MEHFYNFILSIAGIAVSLSTSQYIWIFTMLSLVYMLWNLQKSKRLDLADVLTKNGRSVSLTKVLQLVGGITATWVIVTLTMNNHLTESLFAIYLSYIGGVEAYSKFVAAKYQYDEKSIRDADANTPADAPKTASDESSQEEPK